MVWKPLEKHDGTRYKRPRTHASTSQTKIGQSALPCRFPFIKDGIVYRPTANRTPPGTAPYRSQTTERPTPHPRVHSNQDRISQNIANTVFLHEIIATIQLTVLTQLPPPAFVRRPRASLAPSPCPSWLPRSSPPALPPPAFPSSSTPQR